MNELLAKYPAVLDVATVAEILGVTPATVRRLLKANIIPSVKVGRLTRVRQYDNGNERARKAGIDKNRNTVHNSRKQGTHAEKLDITASKCTKAVNRYQKQKENRCFQNTSACSYPAIYQPPITDACQISCQYDPITDPERKKIHHNCQTEDSIQKDHTSSKMI